MSVSDAAPEGDSYRAERTKLQLEAERRASEALVAAAARGEIAGYDATDLPLVKIALLDGQTVFVDYRGQMPLWGRTGTHPDHISEYRWMHQHDTPVLFAVYENGDRWRWGWPHLMGPARKMAGLAKPESEQRWGWLIKTFPDTHLGAPPIPTAYPPKQPSDGLF